MTSAHTFEVMSLFKDSWSIVYLHISVINMTRLRDGPEKSIDICDCCVDNAMQ